MRLVKLKLSGFKSFVEPTTVLFPGQLAGVVGPNGCGKSNIIDAVRWVLGESKASELRGESIQDVIFKGSGHRKEVSRASVELFFDNQLGRAAGQWSQYAEITVKRLLDREGNSSYYINNLHVRRRDVIDLFLGTGLGPRAYAIIGQGMISRIVEAKPDDLRFFLEEAAGVTKYKERRRGNRTPAGGRHARTWPASTTSATELDGQIGRLEVQAEVARQYRELHGQLARRQSLLWLKKRNDARSEAERHGREVEKAVNRVEAETAQLREVEARVEQAREAHFAASDTLHAVQAEMYAANAEVKRLESEIHHMRRFAPAPGNAAGPAGRRAPALVRRNAGGWRKRISAGAPCWRTPASAPRRPWLATRTPPSVCPRRKPRSRRPAAQVGRGPRGLNEAEQGLRLAEADRGHAVRAIENFTGRRARLEQEKAALAQPDPVQLAAAQETEARAEEELAARQDRVAELQALLPSLDGALRAARERLAAAHRQATEARARHDALVQLQSRVAAKRRDRRLAEGTWPDRCPAIVARHPGRGRLGDRRRSGAARALVGAGRQSGTGAPGAGGAAAGHPVVRPAATARPATQAARSRCAPRYVATMAAGRRCSTSGWPASRRPRNWPASCRRPAKSGSTGPAIC